MLNRKILYSRFHKVNDDILARSKSVIRRKKRSIWIKWGIITACLCFIIFGLTIWNKVQIQPDNSANTLLGADKIYPTIMIQGHLYEWRKGAAICNELPDDCIYYGELIHVEGEMPNNNSEFVSVFSVSGQIYTMSKTDTVIYLCLTTDWMEKTVVAFDIVELER